MKHARGKPGHFMEPMGESHGQAYPSTARRPRDHGRAFESRIQEAGMKWKDTTSYSQGKERTPTTWTARFGVFSLTVTCGHIYYPGQWIARCDPFFDIREVSAKTKEEAMLAAVRIVRGYLMTSISDLNEMQE